METLCIKCKTSPVYIKKRGLCKKCYSVAYQKQRKGENASVGMLHYWEIRHGGEVEFVKNFFDHKDWIYQPATFRLNGTIYHPDFYDGERNVFIEVAGTRQAFHANLEKYQQFIKTFPRIKFEVRYTTGELIPLSETEKGKYRVPNKRNLP